MFTQSGGFLFSPASLFEVWTSTFNFDTQLDLNSWVRKKKKSRWFCTGVRISASSGQLKQWETNIQSAIANSRDMLSILYPRLRTLSVLFFFFNWWDRWQAWSNFLVLHNYIVFFSLEKNELWPNRLGPKSSLDQEQKPASRKWTCGNSWLKHDRFCLHSFLLSMAISIPWQEQSWCQDGSQAVFYSMHCDGWSCVEFLSWFKLWKEKLQFLSDSGSPKIKDCLCHIRAS